MDDNLNKIFNKWDEFKHTHTKLYLPERREAILSLYDRVRLELLEEATFALDDKETDCTITIQATSFVTSDQFPALRDLIHHANTFRSYIQGDQIVFDLWFSFWEWIPNS